MIQPHTRSLERGQGLLWVWIALVICAAIVVALMLSPEQHAGSSFDRSVTGLQRKKPAPCERGLQANCVTIRSAR